MGKLAEEGHASITVAAEPDAVWAVVTDPTRLGEWFSETVDADWTGRWNDIAVGARFSGTNEIGRISSFRINEVTECDPPHVFAWRVIPSGLYPDSTLWRVVCTPAAAGTEVELSFEVLRLNAVLGWWLRRFAPQRRHRVDALDGDLRRLAALV
ncbi:MAG TPA: SRPBCC family protein [Ilumatobacteraceae bacterium]